MEYTKLKTAYDKGYADGIKEGIRIMQQRLLLACENGNPINIEGRAFFIKSYMQNLQDIFSDLERECE